MAGAVACMEEDSIPLHLQSFKLKPVTLKFQDIVYRVKMDLEAGRSVGWWSFAKKLEKERNTSENIILNGISGMVCPGEILAILGHSGSGKTSLLNVLGGRVDAKLSGTVRINGKPFVKPMKRMIGFVTQDDVLYPHLTVRETLLYAAILRLPKTLSRNDKEEQVESIIQELGLSKCRNTMIGGGISGGERKRVSIGHELLLNPSLLLLDEPTSGLDSTTAYRTMCVLQKLASTTRRTIVITIHQPSSRLYHMFHKLILLSHGNSIYFGQPSQALDYFSSIGFSPAFAVNPADFLLDLTNGIVSSVSECGSGNQVEVQEVESSVKQSLVEAYHIYLASDLKAQINIDQSVDSQSTPKYYCRKWTTSWFQQFWVLLERSMKLRRRCNSFDGQRIFQVLSASILAGLLWWHSSIHRIHDQVGLLFFFSVFWGYLPTMDAIFTSPEESVMLVKERSSGMYRLSSYLVARAAGDLPMELILPTLFVTLSYWMGGLKSEGTTFFLTLLVTLYNVVVSQSMGVALGAAIRDAKQAAAFASVTVMTFLLLGGYYIQTVPPFIAWLKYVSIHYHVYKLLLGVQYTEENIHDYCKNNITCRVSDLHPNSTKPANLLFDVVALGIMLVAYRLIAYVLLRRQKITQFY
ncbi:hypothetical protein KI387_003766 [Taxus chinensis]|uniref:ABC transporter domain-containing protein n=1 Tax=Taxus chinensis TaxID=29808 RepID=A0AA38GYD8_TAXCH|nr:hypothetical protein KI387_003766 [Taxus chinensis]